MKSHARGLYSLIFFGIGLLAIFMPFTISSLQAGEPQPVDSDKPTMTVRQTALFHAVDLKPLNPNLLLPKLIPLPTGPGNAAEYYAKLEIFYDQEKIKESNATIPPVPQNSKGVLAILKAATIKDCKLTPTLYPHMEKGTARQPDIAVFEAYLRALLQRAKKEEAENKIKSADSAYRAGMIWGWHLTKNKPNLVSFMLGLSIQVQTAKKYSRFLQRHLDMKRSRVADDIRELNLKIRRSVFLKARVMIGDFNHFNCLYSAIHIAKYDQDYFWRQEAVLRLGVLRHGAPTADLKKIYKDEKFQADAEKALLYVASKDPAPWVRKLATWSIATVTPERFSSMQRKTLFGRRDEALEKEKGKVNSKTGALE